MNLSLRTAPTSLIVSCANLLLTGLALLLGSSGYGEWAVVLFMALLPPLIAAAIFLSLRDIWRRATRSEAVLAILLCLPTLVAEGWFYNWGRGW